MIPSACARTCTTSQQLDWSKAEHREEEKEEVVEEEINVVVIAGDD